MRKIIVTFPTDTSVLETAIMWMEQLGVRAEVDDETRKMTISVLPENEKRLSVHFNKKGITEMNKQGISVEIE